MNIQKRIDKLRASIAEQSAELLDLLCEQWWENHPEIQSLKYEWDWDSDDNGGGYRSYYPVQIKYTVERDEDNERDYDSEYLRYDDEYPRLGDDYNGETFTRPEGI